MATEFDHSRQGRDTKRSMGATVGIVAAAAIAGLLLFTFYDRIPSSGTNRPTASTPDRTASKTTTPPANTTTSTPTK